MQVCEQLVNLFIIKIALKTVEKKTATFALPCVKWSKWTEWNDALIEEGKDALIEEGKRRLLHLAQIKGASNLSAVSWATHETSVVLARHILETNLHQIQILHARTHTLAKQKFCQCLHCLAVPASWNTQPDVCRIQSRNQKQSKLVCYKIAANANVLCAQAPSLSTKARPNFYQASSLQY